MRVKESVTKVNMRTVREAGPDSRVASLGDSLGALAPLTHSFAARICCQKYQLELPAKEARFVTCCCDMFCFGCISTLEPRSTVRVPSLMEVLFNNYSIRPSWM